MRLVDDRVAAAVKAERERVLGLIEAELGLKTGHDFSRTGASLVSVIRRIREESP